MGLAGIYILKVLRRLYFRFKGLKNPSKPECEQNPDKAAQIIFEALMSNKPCMIARFGSTEMNCLRNHAGVKHFKNHYRDYIAGNTPPWWWESSTINQMTQWSGFFPADVNKIGKFCDLMLNDIPEVDILGSWLPDERYFEKELKGSKRVNLELLNPYFSKIPWTKALEGKKVLVVHPFAQTIEMQYKKRELIFQSNLLPAFEIKTLKAVQSIAGKKTAFSDWFEALGYMKSEIDRHDYDVCLIGCGAYGLPLAAHVKRMGKKGFHLGGSLQLLFGIRGNRWENEHYNSVYNYANLMNCHWVKPGAEEKPEGKLPESACYW